MANPDVKGAKVWAKKYLDDLQPKLPELLGHTGDLSYPVELLKELWGINKKNGAYFVPYIVGSYLIDNVGNDPLVFNIVREIIAANRYSRGEIPDAWLEFERDNTLGNTKRPSRRGRTGKEHGVRDLIFKVMAAVIQTKHGLSLGKNEATNLAANGVTTCEVIADAFRDIGEKPPVPASIEKAIRRLK